MSLPPPLSQQRDISLETTRFYGSNKTYFRSSCKISDIFARL